MKKLLILIVLIISAILFALFSDKANEEVKPYLGKFIESKIKDNNVSVEIEEYKLDSNYITLSAKINQKSRVKVYGDFDILTQKFNLNYTINSTEQPVNIKGVAHGSIDSVFLKGAGDALSSKLDYELEFKEQKPQNIQVDIKSAKIEEILALVGEPIYAKGLFDLKINMPKIDKDGGTGDAKFLLHRSLLDSKVILKEQGVVLPPNSRVNGVINSKLEGLVASIDGDIKSNLANLILENGRINLETKALFSEFILDVKELKNLEVLTKTKLNGALKLTGEIEKKSKDLKVSILTKNLGGELRASMEKKSLNIDMKSVEIGRLLFMLNQPKYLRGQLNSKVRLTDLKNPKGTISINTNNVVGINSVLNKEFDLELKKELKIALNTDASIENSIVTSKIKVDSTILNLIAENSIYDIKESKLDASYRLDIPKLSNLEEFARKPLRGSMEVQGEIKKEKELVVTGVTNSFDGKIDFTMIDNQLNSNMKDVSVKKLFHTLKYPLIFSASLSGVLNYDLKEKKGQLSTQLPNAKLIENQLTQLVKQFANIDLTNEVYNQTSFSANIDADIIDFKLLAKSKRNEISVDNAKLNKKTNRIDAKYSVTVDKKDVGGSIKGDVNSPNVSIDGSKFIEKKIGGVINDYMKNGGNEKIKSKLKYFGLDENESKEAIIKAKSFLKGFF